jgi:formylglycine-generating enzyme required for sulfatase activity
MKLVSVSLLICLAIAVSALPIETKKKESNMANELLFIPGGEFIMGINKELAEEIVFSSYPQSSEISPYIFYNECPEHKVKVGDFRIAQYETSNEEFQEFVNAGGYQKKEFWRELLEIKGLNTDYMGWDRIKIFVDSTNNAGPATWKSGKFPEGKGNHPVDGVSWFEAAAYCRWKKLKLPSEAQWEYAARGTDRRSFPWGNDPVVFQKFGTRQAGQTSPVGSISEDRSPLGVMDMARNVSEWVQDDYTLYPGAPLDPVPADETFGILRGGEYLSQPPQMRSTHRARTNKLERRPGIGFRCAADGR